MTPGYKTTEFWLTLVAYAVALFLASGFFPDTHVAIKVASLVGALLAQLGYTTSRAKLKAAELAKPVEPVL